MKKLFLVPVVLWGMGSSYGMHDVSTQMSALSLDSNASTPFLERKQADNSDQKHADDEKEYLVFKHLINAIYDADDATVKTILTDLKQAEKNKDTYSSSYSRDEYFLDGYFRKMIAKYPFPLVRDFTDKLGAVLKEQWPYPKEWPWPFGPLWLALEMVIYGERHNEPQDNKVLYLKRLSILQQVYNVDSKQRDNNESLVLRKNCPPDFCTCVLLLCCLSWPCVCADVKGYPMHRAVQAKSIKAYEILTAKCTCHYSDYNGWSAEQYAAFYGADEVLAYLRMKKLANPGCCMESSCCLACFSNNKKVRQILNADRRCGCC